MPLVRKARPARKDRKVLSARKDRKAKSGPPGQKAKSALKDRKAREGRPDHKVSKAYLVQSGLRALRAIQVQPDLLAGTVLILKSNGVVLGDATKLTLAAV